MMSKNYGIIVSLLICFTACDPTPTILSPEPKADDKWTYRIKYYDESGNVTSSLDYNSTATGFNIGTQVIEPWVSIKMDDFPDYSNIPCGDYRLREDGLYHIINLSLGGTPTMFIPYPGNIGQAVTHTYNPDFAVSRTIVSVNDTLTVPYGFFSALYKYDIEYTGMGVTNKLWFNDSVWIVKYETIDSLTIGTGVYVSSSIELVNYTAH
jgi:hypothetical protein